MGSVLGSLLVARAKAHASRINYKRIINTGGGPMNLTRHTRIYNNVLFVTIVYVLLYGHTLLDHHVLLMKTHIACHVNYFHYFHTVMSLTITVTYIYANVELHPVPSLMNGPMSRLS